MIFIIMPQLTIQISDYLQKFLERYFSGDTSLDFRFYQALDEGLIISKGKGFCLTVTVKERFEKILKEDERKNTDTGESDYYDYT